MRKILLLFLSFFIIGGITHLSAQVTMPTSGNITIQQCTGTILDSGGNGAYQNSVNSSATILAPDDVEVITLNFSSFNLESCCDDLIIYDGPDTSSPLIGIYAGTDLPNGGTVESTGPAITLQFITDGSVTYDGFEAEWSWDCNAITVEPVANFEVNSIACNGVANFQDLSSDFPAEWAWDFGDGNISNEQSPTYIYTTSGTFDVTLEVCNVNGCNSYTLEQAVTVVDCENILLPNNGPGDLLVDCAGILQDNGGDDIALQGSTSSVTIAPPGVSQVSVLFSEFGMYAFGSGGLYIYDGPDTSSPLIGFYQASSIAPGTTITTTGPEMTLELVVDPFGLSNGFTLQWTGVGGTEQPIASFEIPDDTPPAGVPVQFLDTSENFPGAWVWDFGDGTLGYDQNPTHVYEPGEYEINMIASNCYGVDTTATQTITVQNYPAVNVLPIEYNLTLDAGTIHTEDLLIVNTSQGGDLFFDIDGLESAVSGSTRVVALMNGVQVEEEYTRTVEAIDAFYQNYVLDTLSAYAAEDLAAALLNADVLLIPEIEDCDALNMLTLSPAITDFTGEGGTTVMLGTSSGSCVNNTGLFSGSYGGFVQGGETLSVNDPADPLMAGVNSSFPVFVATFYYNFSNEDMTNLIQYTDPFGGQEYTVVGHRPVGLGQAVFIGFDYFNSNDDMKKIVANAVKSNLNEFDVVQWLSANPESDEVPPFSEYTVELTFDLTNVNGGTYNAGIYVNSNDPNVPQIYIPITLTVIGTPMIELSTTDIDFGNVVQFTNVTETVVIDNPGSDSLFVTGITSTNPNIEIDIESFTLEPGLGQNLVVTFSPEDIQLYEGEIIIETNIGEYIITVAGNGTGAPVIQVSPESIDITLDSSDSSDEILEVANVGLGDLNWEAQLENLVNPYEKPQILSLTYSIDNFYYTNILAVIDAQLDDYTLDELNTTNPDALAEALQSYNILLLPPNFGNLDTFTAFSAVVDEFMEAGGTVVMVSGTGFTNTEMLYSMGLFQGGFSEYFFGGLTEVAVITFNHPVVEDVPLIFDANSTYTTHQFTNSDLIPLVQWNSNDVVAARQVGQGGVVYIGWDFFNYTEGQAQILGNAMKWGASNAVSTDWVGLDLNDGTVPFPDGLTELTVTIDADGLYAGVYTADIVFSSNDPLLPSVTIPVILTVIGHPEVSLSATEDLDFGSIVVGATSTQTVTVTNSGTDTLTVDQFLSDFPDDYVVTPADLQVPPGQSVNIDITFTPTEVGEFNTDLEFDSNEDENTLLGLLGIGQPAPLASVDPESIEVTLQQGETAEEGITLSNSGEGILDYNILGDPDVPTEILFYANNSNEFVLDNVKNAIQTYYGDYNGTDFASTVPEDLEDALKETNVMVIPQTNFSADAGAIFASFSDAMSDFVEGGGTVIFTSTFCTECIVNTSLFSGFTGNFLFADEMTNQEASHPLMNDIPTSFFSAGGGYAFNFNNSDVNVVMTSTDFNGQPVDVVGYREIGFGKAVYIGFDFNTVGADESQILANAIEWGGGALPDWLTITDFEGSVDPDGNVVIELDINSTGLPANVYVYNVIIQTNDPLNPVIIVPVTLNVIDFPAAGVGSDITVGCGTGVIQFFDESINTPTSWTWDFGDGNTSNEQNPEHEYTESGVYTVTLEACNDLGCDEIVVENYITIDYECTEFNFPTSGEETFTSCTGTLFDPGGDGPYSNNTSAVVTIAPEGTLNITLNFDSFALETCCDDLYIYDGDSTDPGILVNPDGLITSIGDTWTSTGPVITLQFVTDGSVTNDGFEITWECALANIPPIPDYAYEFDSPCNGLVAFSDSTTLEVTEWLWDFGDGETSTEQNPVHQYTESGTYDVTLVSTNQWGSSDPFTQTVEVDVLVLDFFVPETAAPGEGIFDFSDSTEGAITWSWDMGDGSFPYEIQTPIHVYNEPGVYTVTLTVTNINGCPNSASQEIAVNPVSIEDLSATNSLKAYPNPTNGLLNVNYQFEGKENISIKLFDALGREVFNQETQAIDLLNHQINVDGFTNGMYTLQVSDSKGTMTERILVQ